MPISIAFWCGVFTDHERTDKYEICLLQSEGPLPMDHRQSHHPKVPDPEGKGDPVDGKVVHLEDVPGRVGVYVKESSLLCRVAVDISYHTRMYMCP